MSENAISAHGTMVARQPLGAGPFTDIAELRDISGPELQRNSIETLAHNDNIDHYAVGVRRRGEMTFTLGFVPSLGTHDHLTGLTKAWDDGSRDIYRISYPDGSIWMLSGYVTNIGPSMPVDDGLEADVTIRPTGPMSFS
jgi:hypothetical protein